MENKASYIKDICRRAKKAGQIMATLSAAHRKKALEFLIAKLQKGQDDILAANSKEIAMAKDKSLASALIDRLTLTPERIAGMVKGLEGVIALPDLLDEVFDQRVLPNGLKLYKRRVPLGVLAVIYESRPNVTIDVASLVIKSGNAVILRGGSETLNTNQTLISCVSSSLTEAGIPSDTVLLIDNPDREMVQILLKMHEFVNMLIPRGGAKLHAFCRENSLIPVITGGIGICHLFVDESADLKKALCVIRNAKVQRPTVCNALDTVLIHQSIAHQFVVDLIDTLSKDGVEFRVTDQIMQDLQLEDSDVVIQAGSDDFDTEWLSLVLGVKRVRDVDEAIAFVCDHSTGHSDGILTQNRENAQKFIKLVDSAVVYVNASTRFTDGGEFGLGTEVAVSTQRLHARGPMGLQELTTYKWVVEGDYHVRG
jgi:glutamate-5-semialdehyde dehydrogenase